MSSKKVLIDTTYSQIELTLQDVDHYGQLIQTPAAKRTMMMKPKQKQFLTKSDAKFRINSATTRRTLNAVSTANDESRLTNFIQHENYEINSFRSNDKNPQNGNQQHGNSSIEGLRESWNKNLSTQLKFAEQSQTTPKEVNSSQVSMMKVIGPSIANQDSHNTSYTQKITSAKDLSNMRTSAGNQQQNGLKTNKLSIYSQQQLGETDSFT